MQWGPEFFCVHKDNQLLAHAKVEGDNTRLIQLQSKIYVWAIERRCRPLQGNLHVQPLYTYLDDDVSREKVTCCICGQKGRILRGRWASCFLCQSWVCAGHARRHPDRRCPNCVEQLKDFLGGKEAQVTAQEVLADIIPVELLPPDLAPPEPRRVYNHDWDGVWDLPPYWWLHVHDTAATLAENSMHLVACFFETHPGQRNVACYCSSS